MFDWFKSSDYSYLITFLIGFVIPFITFLPKILEPIKIEKEIKKLKADKDKLDAEKIKLQEETMKISKESTKLISEQEKLEEEGLKLEKEKEKFNAERGKLEEETLKLNEEKLKFQAETIKLQEEATKIKKEVEKINIEIRQKRMELQKDAQVFQRVYENKVILGQNLTKEYINFITAKDLNNLEKKREEICDNLLNEIFPMFNSYFILQKIVFEEDEKQRKSFIENELIKLFKTCKIVVGMLNREDILSRIQKPKLMISKEMIDSYFQYVSENFNDSSDIIKELKQILSKFGINY